MGKSIRIGLLGLGTVGGGVAHILQGNAPGVAAKAGAALQLGRIAVRDVSRPRDATVDQEQLTTDPHSIVQDPDIDIVVEVMGGIEPARSLVTEALQRGKHVVTANKELIAHHGSELLALGRRYNAGLFYEASVGGGIPIIRPLRACLAANRIRSVSGIINGTTNYMLTRMTAEGRPFDEMLQQAQELGYAEADPAADVDGHDAAFKIAILAALAFDAEVDVEQVYREGISRVTPEDIADGKELGYTLKLLAVARKADDGLDVRVHPTFIPAEHPLAAVNDVFNAVFVNGDAVGDLMFYGRGAGALPTASAVVADVIEAARHKLGGGHRVPGPPSDTPRLIDIDETVSRYYVSLRVLDRPGVLGQVASAFGDEEVSLDRVIQKGSVDGSETSAVRLVVVTHEARHRQLQEALGRIRGLEHVHGVDNVIRVKDGDVS